MKQRKKIKIVLKNRLNMYLLKYMDITKYAYDKCFIKIFFLTTYPCELSRVEDLQIFKTLLCEMLILIIYDTLIKYDLCFKYLKSHPFK